MKSNWYSLKIRISKIIEMRMKNSPCEFYRKDSNAFDAINDIQFQESANRFKIDNDSEEMKKNNNSRRPQQLNNFEIDELRDNSFDHSLQADNIKSFDNNEIDYKIEIKKVKINGWKWPLHIFQVLTWLIGAFDFLYMFGEVFPYIRYREMLVIFMIGFMILTFVLLVLCIILTWSDPTDPVVYEERLKIQKELATWNSEGSNEICKMVSKYKVIDTRDYVNSEWAFVWDICLTHVQNRTKHCREWNRWVSMFDHHWKWLNNCIGDKNYK